MRMGTLIGCTVVVLSVVAAAAAGQAAAPKVVDVKTAAPGLSDALMAKEKAIIAAVLSHDKAAISKSLTPDGWMVDEGGYGVRNNDVGEPRRHVACRISPGVSS